MMNNSFLFWKRSFVSAAFVILLPFVLKGADGVAFILLGVAFIAMVLITGLGIAASSAGSISRERSFLFLLLTAALFAGILAGYLIQLKGFPSGWLGFDVFSCVFFSLFLSERGWEILSPSAGKAKGTIYG